MTTNTTTATAVKITLNQLKGLNACEEQLKLFEETFGEEVSFKTKAQAVKVAVKMAHKFDFYWASDNLLKGDCLEVYLEALAPFLKAYNEAEAPLLKAYNEAKAPFLKAYNEAEAPLLKAYNEAKATLLKVYLEALAPFLKAYEEAEAPLLKAYNEAKAPLWEAYEEAIAKKFAECYFDQEEQNRITCITLI